MNIHTKGSCVWTSSVHHPVLTFGSGRCLQTGCLAAALSALAHGAHPVPVMDSLFIQLFLGQKGRSPQKTFPFSTITKFAHPPTGVKKQPSSTSRPHLPAFINVRMDAAAAHACARLLEHMFVCGGSAMWTGISGPTLAVTPDPPPPPWPLCRSPGWLEKPVQLSAVLFVASTLRNIHNMPAYFET